MIDRLRRAWSSSPRRTFVLYPLASVAFEALRGRPPRRPGPAGLLLMAAGYALYRAAGAHRAAEGGGGPGFAARPDRLVTGGPYAVVRNPMYLGHLVFLVGLVAATRSPAALAALVAQWRRLSLRVGVDEARLAELFGPAYADYVRAVPRWLPGLPPAPRYVLFHRIAEPESARVRRLVVGLGLERRVDFQNADTDGADRLRRLGGAATPALWDGQRLVLGSAAVEGAVRRIIPQQR